MQKKEFLHEQSLIWSEKTTLLAQTWINLINLAYIFSKFGI